MKNPLSPRDTLFVSAETSGFNAAGVTNNEQRMTNSAANAATTLDSALRRWRPQKKEI